MTDAEFEHEYFEDPQLSELLSSLNSDNTPMPADVWAGVSATIGAEVAARGGAQQPPSQPSQPASAGAQVVSLADRVRTRTKLNLIGAAAVAAAAGGIWLIGGNHLGTTHSSVASGVEASLSASPEVRTLSADLAGGKAGQSEFGSSSDATTDPSPTGLDNLSAPLDDGSPTPTVAVRSKVPVTMTVSGKTYRRSSLMGEAMSGKPSGDQVQADAVPDVFAPEAECVTAEISRLAYEDPNTEVTADLGFLDGQPVAVLVERNKIDKSATPRVYVLTSNGTCSLEPVNAQASASPTPTK